MSGGKISMRWGAMLAVAGAVVLIGALPSGVAAQRGRAELNEGNRFYEEGRFPEAPREIFWRPFETRPTCRSLSSTMGTRSTNLRSTSGPWTHTAGRSNRATPALASPAWYNLGNALYRQQRFQESPRSLQRGPPHRSGRDRLQAQSRAGPRAAASAAGSGPAVGGWGREPAGPGTRESRRGAGTRRPQDQRRKPGRRGPGAGSAARVWPAAPNRRPAR